MTSYDFAPSCAGKASSMPSLQAVKCMKVPSNFVDVIAV
jgi:hypothetical protein